jgi:flavin-dependent dehydrogenase
MGDAFDVVVVGGGPAGSACAIGLAQRGYAVALVERAEHPRRKVCGEYLNPGAVGALEELGVRERVLADGRPLKGIRIVPPSGGAVALDFPRAAFGMPRATLDARLFAAARDAGATTIQARTEDVTRDADGRTNGVRLRGADGVTRVLSARTVVGADGAGSLVARKSGLTAPLPKARRYAVGGHYRGFAGLDDYVEMYVGAGAYFAVNPLADDLANVMVVVPHERLEAWSADVDAGVSGHAAALGRDIRSFAGAERVGERVAVGPLAHRTVRRFGDGTILVGDAGGFLNPFTGQGVMLALRSAAAAAEAIDAALRDPARERAIFTRYDEAIARDFATRKRLSAMVGLLIDIAPLARRASSRLARVPSLAATLVDAVGGAIAPERAFAPHVLARLLL